MSEQTILSGRVTRIGYYRDTLPKLVITIPKCTASGLSVCEGDRVDIHLFMNGESYHAGIRTTSKSKTLTICPDMLDSTGKEIRLTDLLLRNNIQQKATVTLSISAEGIVIIT